jgi:microcystin-dependent protein
MKSMKNSVRFFIAMALVLASAVFAFAQSDIKISIQGTLKDANSSAVDDGAYDVTFRLYNTNSGGTAVWEETANVQVSGGVYSHRLGSVEALDASDFSETLFVGVEVNGVELSPRTELTYAPYTLNTQFAARAGNGVPAGSMMPFAGPLSKVPDDYIPCDGRALSSSEYPELFAAIGTVWGNGTTGIGSQDGNTDFNVPDSRGVFLRGWDNGRGIDSGRSLASYQADNNKSHSHSFSGSGTTGNNGGHSHSIIRNRNDTDNAHDPNGGNDSEGSAITSDRKNVPQKTFNTGSVGDHAHSFSFSGTTGSSGSEARPKNIAVLYIIKK